MDGQEDRYQRAADHCLQMALNENEDRRRVSWLNLAQGWLQMIPPDPINIRISPAIANGKKPSHDTRAV